jgi:menaquinone-9 beta-reductase
MKAKFVIIGGGVAGLCAAIRLAELGEESLLIEGGSYPSHKICGEFLSPECIPYLENWNIHPIAISDLVLRTSTHSIFFPFPSSAGGMSHVALDPALANDASLKGVKIKTNTLVHSFQPKKHAKDVHLIQLSNQETIEASTVIIAAGRFLNPSSHPPLLYKGFKAHFEHLPLEGSKLEMFSFPGAYLGICPIEGHKYNVACLADLNKVKSVKPLFFIEHLMAQNPRLHFLLSEGKNLFDDWMVASLPGFGLKQTPGWLDAYFIGDAAMTVPPACGNGLSLAIFGGRYVAEYSVRGQFHDFKKMWMKRCSSQLFWAKVLHRLMFHPSTSTLLLQLANTFPSIIKKGFELTRQRTSHHPTIHH